MYFKQFRRPLKFSFTIIIGIIIFNILTAAPTNTPQTSDRIKGVWLSHVGNSLLTYTSAIDNVFYRLSQQNYNTVYVDVYNGGTTYPSKYSSRNKLISFPFTDPLQTAIKEGKRQGLHIYAWYEHGMMLFPKQKLAQQHPDWILKTSDGRQYIEQHLWLNPENPEVQEYFVNLFTEVAQKYPKLYGIQVDDHWGIPIIFGNKTQAMTELTRRIVRAVKQTSPNLIISLSPNPYQFSVNKYSLDWTRWIEEKLFDELVIQIYRPDSQQVTESILTSGIKEASQYVKVAVGIYAGGDPQLKSLSEIDRQVNVVKKFDYGYSIFSWEYTSIFLRKAIYLFRQLL
ncbi:MAG: family 10 glycosylhydrolase [Pleurocapsa sp. CRU_1_2]|nr:family 10 glycosylhydrolase [Pleurocapsa sp. CRU_1_2]